MIVGLARFDLRLPAARSLKDKRSVLRGLTSMVKGKFNVAVSEVDHHDLWQRSTLAVAVIADAPYHAQRVLREVERHVETDPRVEHLGTTLDMLGPE